MIRYIHILFFLSSINLHAKTPDFSKPIILETEKNTVDPKSINYQIGPSWNRELSDSDNSKKEIAQGYLYEKLLKATARVRSKTSSKSTQTGTAVYLGFFEDSHILITNNHVLSDPKLCNHSTEVTFLYKNKKFFCKKIHLTLKAYDLTVFSIHAKEDDKNLVGNALSIDFESEFPISSTLYSAGHGYYQNAPHRLTADFSSDCQLMRSNKLVLFVKSKTANAVAIPSIIHSCELSPGDSGSVIIGKTTGKIIGLNYFVGKKRSPLLLLPDTLEKWKIDQPWEMFESLSYAVPTEHIKFALSNQANNPAHEESTRKILKKIVEKNSTPEKNSDTLYGIF